MSIKSRELECFDLSLHYTVCTNLYDVYVNVYK